MVILANEQVQSKGPRIQCVNMTIDRSIDVKERKEKRRNVVEAAVHTGDRWVKEEKVVVCG